MVTQTCENGFPFEGSLNRIGNKLNVFQIDFFCGVPHIVRDVITRPDDKINVLMSVRYLSDGCLCENGWSIARVLRFRPKTGRRVGSVRSGSTTDGLIAQGVGTGGIPQVQMYVS